MGYMVSGLSPFETGMERTEEKAKLTEIRLTDEEKAELEAE